MSLRTLSGRSALAFLLGTLTCPAPIRGCAAAPPRGYSVGIADESAIILWDAKSKTQHFVRRASFHTNAKDFGFLVPTPSKPSLAEAPDKAFEVLAKITAPKVVTKPRPSSGPGCGCAASRMAPAGKAPAVRVLEEKRVAGHDAAVLEADDTEALGKWLKDHDYPFSPALAEWVKPYVKSGWKVTAFKVAKDSAKEPNVATSAVRMTFQTDTPFFPYREPPGQATEGSARAPGPRLLRVFFLGDSRVQGTLGKGGAAWPGKTAWADALEPAQRDEILKLLKLPAKTTPPSWWLTEFEDPSSPRPGKADVYFSRSDDQSPVERPPEVHYTSRSAPDCVFCYALAAYLLVPGLVRRLRRGDARSP
jgi:hypothetical protein